MTNFIHHVTGLSGHFSGKRKEGDIRLIYNLKNFGGDVIKT